tara:strand:+ start:2341 stop:2583 length:243 start_codon:yes stop_codon:yes gene_type:complete
LSLRPTFFTYVLLPISGGSLKKEYETVDIEELSANELDALIEKIRKLRATKQPPHPSNMPNDVKQYQTQLGQLALLIIRA